MSKQRFGPPKREIKLFLIIGVLGTLMIITNPDAGSWKFPLAMTQEWRVRARLMGWLLLAGGYPISLILRFIALLTDKIRKPK